jgi:hypothetical protein
MFRRTNGTLGGGVVCATTGGVGATGGGWVFCRQPLSISTQSDKPKHATNKFEDKEWRRTVASLAKRALM